jgi:hypothetical protein
MLTTQRGAAAFGDEALAYARRLPDACPVIVADPMGLSAACGEAIKRRAVGTPFIATVLVAESIAAIAPAVSGQLLARSADHDDLRNAFDQLAARSLVVNGSRLDAVQWYPPAILRALTDFLHLADAVWFRSHAEVAIVERLIGYRPPRFTVSAVLDPAVPSVPGGAARGAPHVVVWAPARPASQLGVQLLALEELHVPVTVVCASGDVTSSRAHLVGIGAAKAALAQATLVVDAETIDPGTALALARLNVPLVATKTGGADEYLDDLLTYDPASYRSLTYAVESSLAGRAPRVRAGAPLAVPPAPQRDEPRTGPLVSVLIPTFNRRALLGDALASAEAQTYENIEIVVANDAGEPVDDVVAAFPRARLVNLAENGGAPKAVNAAFREAKGEYVCWVADDDVLFPDHACVLVDALERTGAHVAHADAITAGVMVHDGGYMLAGLIADMSHAMDLSTQHFRNLIGTTTVMMRRSAFLPGEEPLDMSIPFSRDYEVWLRLAKRYDFVHVPRVTSAYSLRNDNTNIIVQHPERHLEAFERIFAKHPAGGRPTIIAGRNAMLDAARRNALTPQPPAPMFEPIPWPPTKRHAPADAVR